MTTETRQSPSEASAPAGPTVRSDKYLTFQLGQEEYGLEILRVQEIIGLIDITPVPMTSECVRGVVNLRGKIIPVLDLRRKFGMVKTVDHPRNCIVVVDYLGDKGNKVPMSILVDTVSEVLDISSADIESSPSFGGGVSVDYIAGIAKVKGKVKILLNLDAVVSADVIGVSDQSPALEGSS